MTTTVTPVPDASLPLPDPYDLGTWGARMTEMHRWMRLDLRPGMNTLAADTYTNALAAVAAANFKGAWSALTGALAVPASVAHGGGIWLLLSDLADVTTETPGVSAEWLDISGVRRSGDTMTGHLNTIAGASGTQVPQAQETAMLATTQFSFRNRLINPFTENQRALTSVADDTYCLDRWYVLTESGNVTVAQTTDPESGAPFGIRLTQPDATAKRIGLAQIIESKNIRQYASQAMNLFARAKLSAASAIRYAIIEHTGTADVVTSDVVSNWASGTFTPSNFFIAGINILKTGSVTPGAATWGDVDDWTALGASVQNVVVFFWTESALAQNGTLDINRPQLEPGVVATPHEWRMNELDLCQRYAERTFMVITHVGSPVLQGMRWRVAKRVPPALSATFDVGSGATFTNTGSSVYAVHQATLNSALATANVFGTAEL